MILKEKKNFCQKNKIKFFNGYPCKNFTKYFCIHIILFQNILSIFLMCSLSKKTLFSSSKETKIYDPLRSGGGVVRPLKKHLFYFCLLLLTGCLAFALLKRSQLPFKFIIRKFPRIPGIKASNEMEAYTSTLAISINLSA